MAWRLDKLHQLSIFSSSLPQFWWLWALFVVLDQESQESPGVCQKQFRTASDIE